MEKDSATIIAAESTVIASAALYEEGYEIHNNSSAGFAVTTLVAIFRYEPQSLND